MVKSYRKIVNELKVGKRTRSAIYVHESAWNHLCFNLRNAMFYRTTENIIKFSRLNESFSLLDYPNFYELDFPRLRSSKHINLETEKVTNRLYKKNPPVIHRKELMMDPDHPLRERFAKLTRDMEDAKLFPKEMHKLGLQEQWRAHLHKSRYEVVDHKLKEKWMQYKVWFPKFKPIKKTSGYALYVFEKDDLEKILKDWNKQAYWLLKNNHDQQPKGEDCFHGTAIARKKAPAPMRAYFDLPGERRDNPRILYHGCGRDEAGFEALGGLEFVDAYDPYSPSTWTRILPDGMYDEIHSHYTLNVVTPSVGRDIFLEIYGRLNWAGEAIISVRRDLK